LRQHSVLGPQAGVAVAFAVAIMMFCLAFLWYRYSERLTHLGNRYMGRLIRREPNGGWALKFNKYYGTIFLVLAGIYCIVLAIRAAIRL